MRWSGKLALGLLLLVLTINHASVRSIDTLSSALDPTTLGTPEDDSLPFSSAISSKLRSTKRPPRPTKVSTTEPPGPTDASTTEPPRPTKVSTTEPPRPTKVSTTEPPRPTKVSTTEPPISVNTSTTEPPKPTNVSTTRPPISVNTSTTEPPKPTINTTTTTTSTTLKPPVAPTKLVPTESQTEKSTKSKGLSSQNLIIIIVVVLCSLLIISSVIGTVFFLLYRRRQNSRNNNESGFEAVSPRQEIKVAHYRPGEFIPGAPLPGPKGYEPESMSPSHFKHMGVLKINKDQPVVSTHDLENVPSDKSASSEKHAVWDDKENVVYDIGSEVEEVLDQKGNRILPKQKAPPTADQKRHGLGNLRVIRE